VLALSLAQTFMTHTALRGGLSYRALYRMGAAGDVVALSRGVYRFADAPSATFPDLLAVAYRVSGRRDLRGVGGGRTQPHRRTLFPSADRYTPQATSPPHLLPGPNSEL